jgi:hypothetical protein
LYKSFKQNNSRPIAEQYQTTPKPNLKTNPNPKTNEKTKQKTDPLGHRGGSTHPQPYRMAKQSNTPDDHSYPDHTSKDPTPPKNSNHRHHPETPRCINAEKQITVRETAQLTENRTPLQKRRRKTTSQEIGGRGGHAVHT